MSGENSFRKVVLHFPHRLVSQPIVCGLVREHNLDFNILKALVTPKEEGLLILELCGKERDLDNGLEYLKEAGVKTQPLSRDVVRNDERCTHCGACVTICPVDALVVDLVTRKVSFQKEKCIACELCVRGCPSRAMEVHF